MYKKFKFSGIFLLLLFSFALNGQAHKFYVSLCRINYVPDSAQLQITIRIFTDDLEKALWERDISKVRLGTDQEPPEADSLLSEYLVRHFRLMINGRSLPLRFLGKEVSYDVTWCYLESQDVKPFEELTVESDLLTAQFPDQINLVELSAGEVEKGVMLNHDNTRASIKLR